jgi:hypothetical protein
MCEAAVWSRWSTNTAALPNHLTGHTPTGDYWGSLVQYLLLAEQGCDTAATNAAYMLKHGEGYSGPGYLDLARQLYARWGVNGVVMLCPLRCTSWHTVVNARHTAHGGVVEIWRGVCTDSADPHWTCLPVGR